MASSPSFILEEGGRGLEELLARGGGHLHRRLPLGTPPSAGDECRGQHRSQPMTAGRRQLQVGHFLSIPSLGPSLAPSLAPSRDFLVAPSGARAGNRSFSARYCFRSLWYSSRSGTS